MAAAQTLGCGCWTQAQHDHVTAEDRYVRAQAAGDREATWQAHLDMLKANDYHVPERSGRP